MAQHFCFMFRSKCCLREMPLYSRAILITLCNLDRIKKAFPCTFLKKKIKMEGKSISSFRLTKLKALLTKRTANVHVAELSNLANITARFW